MNWTKTILRAAKALLAVTLAAGGLLFASASPATAHNYPGEPFHTSVIITGSAPVRACTYLSDPQNSCKNWTSIPVGNTVSMVCWRKQGPSTDSRNYGTDMYFWVKGKNGANNGGSTVQGYVSANRVGAQWGSSPYCDNMLRFRAARWAGEQLGQTDYNQKCQTFVHDAYSKGAGKDIGSVGITRGAIHFWTGYPNQSYLTGETIIGNKKATASTDAPVGALVYWSEAVGSQYGHAAMSIGSGWVVSTGFGGSTQQRVFHISKYPTGYLGWIQF